MPPKHGPLIMAIIVGLVLFAIFALIGDPTFGF